MPLVDPLDLFATRGHTAYGGERVSQAEHARQAAALAQAAGAPASLIVAALLHDVGHLLVDVEDEARRLRDLRHEEMGARYLGRWFGPAVTEPIRLHVAAKRYLARDPNYAALLSDESQRSLRRQGGVMGEAEAEEFRHQPYFEDAVRLRQWDDAAKECDWQGVALESFQSLVEEVREIQ